MSIFRLQEHVPDVYPRKSRDFQLMCNLYDCVNNGVKYDIDSIVNIVDTKTCSSSVIPLLQTKLGFFCNKEYSTEQLRVVLSGFQHALKHKGSRRGVLEAIQLYLKAQGVSRGSKVSVTNKPTNKGTTSVSGEYIVDVGIESEMLDTSLLTDILRYILPAGYKLEYSFYTGYDQSSEIDYEDKVTVVLVSKGVNDGIRDSSFYNSYDFRKSGLNYILLKSKPLNWGTSDTEYFIYEEDQFQLVIKVGRNPLPDPSKELYYYKCTNPKESDEFKRTYEKVTGEEKDYDKLVLWEVILEKCLVAPKWEVFEDNSKWYAHKSDLYTAVETEPTDWESSYLDYVIMEETDGVYTKTDILGVKPQWDKDKHYYNISGKLIKTESDFNSEDNEYVYQRTVNEVSKEKRYPDFKEDTYYVAEVDYMNVNSIGTTHMVSRDLHNTSGDTLEVTKYSSENDKEES